LGKITFYAGSVDGKDYGTGSLHKKRAPSKLGENPTAAFKVDFDFPEGLELRVAEGEGSSIGLGRFLRLLICIAIFTFN
jgi:hypothetical protein